MGMFPYIGLIYGRYLQFRILKIRIPLIKMSPAVALPIVTIVPYGAPPGIPGVCPKEADRHAEDPGLVTTPGLSGHPIT